MRVLGRLFVVAFALSAAGCGCSGGGDYTVTFSSTDASTNQPLPVAMSEILGSGETFACLTPPDPHPIATTRCTAWEVTVDDGANILVAPHGYESHAIPAPPAPADACTDPTPGIDIAIFFQPEF